METRENILSRFSSYGFLMPNLTSRTNGYSITLYPAGFWGANSQFRQSVFRPPYIKPKGGRPLWCSAGKNQETNLLGIYAAGGNCGPPRQIAKSLGEGCVADIEAAQPMPPVKNNTIYRKTFEMHRKAIRIILWTLVLLLTWSAGGTFKHTGVLNPAGVSAVRAETPTSTDNAEIQWFKDQMGISEKYMEDQEGIWGMSWAHFFTMVFLVLIALAGLAVFIQRQKKTREIMEIIQKEIKDGSSG